MVLSVLHKSFSLLLAILILASTTPIRFEQHFCGDNLIDVAFFSEADKCSEDEVLQQINKNVITPQSCCKDLAQVVVGQEHLNLKPYTPILKTLAILYVVSYPYFEINTISLETKQASKFFYPPPEIVLEIYKYNQVFLI